MKLLYTQSNYSRLPAFRLQTSLLQSSKGLIVEKKTVSAEGVDHLIGLQRNQALIHHNYPTLKLPKIIKAGQNYIQYEFINGINLQAELEEAIFNKAYVKANELIKEVVSWISELTVAKVDRTQYISFAKFLGISEVDLKILKPQSGALIPAVMDLKLANLIRLDSDLYLVDTEWVYDWHAPTRFILWRTLVNILINLQSLTRYSASLEFPSYKLSDYHQCPISWWNLFDFSIAEYRVFARWESFFQRHVTGRTFDTNLLLYPYINSVAGFTMVDSYPTVSSQLPQILQQIESQAQQIELQEKIITIQAEISRLKADLHKIKSAKFFKLWQGYNSVKKAFK